VLAVAIVACASNRGSALAVRVGRNVITQAMVSQWMTMMAPEHVLPDPPRYDACIRRAELFTPQSETAVLREECRVQYRTLEQQALDLLIASRWLVDEAASLGLSVSRQQPRQLVPEGRVAASAIRRWLIASEPPVTKSQIVRLYREHIDRSRVPERRDFHIVEGLPSAAAGRALMAQIASGRRKIEGIEESKVRPRQVEPGPRHLVLVEIFMARPHVLTGPIRMFSRYAVFEITKLHPAFVRPLREVGGSIRQELTRARRRATLAHFIREWRRRWTARTDCAVGYVVQKCRQYRGPRSSEDPLTFN
jgi:foldase protein PrsA